MATKIQKAQMDELVKRLGGPEAIAAGLERYERQVHLIESKRAELTARYPDHWVAAHGDKIVAADPDFYALFSKLDELRIPRGEAAVEFLETQRTFWAL